MGSWILCMQFFLISVGALALAIGVSFTVPTAVKIRSIILSCLKPPYLHILVNAIIITIAASSRFCQSTAEAPTRLTSVKTAPPAAYLTAYSAQPEVPQAGEDEVIELKAVMVNGLEVGMEDEEGSMTSDVGRKLTYDSLQPPERPIGNIPAEAMEEKYETLESIWKKIMEGKSCSSHEEVQNISLPSQKEASPNQDELNHRVETFIKKVKHEMKMERQKSLNQSVGVTNYRV